MDNVTKVLMAIVGVGMVTTAILPGRQTAAVMDSFTKFFTGAMGTVMAVPVRK